MMQNTSFGNTSGGRNRSRSVTAVNEVHNNANSDADGGEVPHFTAPHRTALHCTLPDSMSAGTVPCG